MTKKTPEEASLDFHSWFSALRSDPTDTNQPKQHTLLGKIVTVVGNVAIAPDKWLIATISEVQTISNLGDTIGFGFLQVWSELTEAGEIKYLPGIGHSTSIKYSDVQSELDEFGIYVKVDVNYVRQDSLIADSWIALIGITQSDVFTIKAEVERLSTLHIIHPSDNLFFALLGPTSSIGTNPVSVSIATFDADNHKISQKEVKASYVQQRVGNLIRNYGQVQLYEIYLKLGGYEVGQALCGITVKNLKGKVFYTGAMNARHTQLEDVIAKLNQQIEQTQAVITSFDEQLQEANAAKTQAILKELNNLNNEIQDIQQVIDELTSNSE